MTATGRSALGSAANLLVHKQFTQLAGGFDARLACGEEADLFYRALRDDYTVHYTPRAIVQKLNAGVNDALAQPDVRKRLGDLGMEIVGGSAEDATKYVMDQAARVRGLIKAGVLTPVSGRESCDR